MDMKISAVHRFLFLIVLLVARVASESTANISFLMLVGYSLLGRTQAIHALFLSWLLTFLNPGIFPDAKLGGVGRYLVLAGASASIWLRQSHLGWREGLHVNRLNLWTLLLGLGFVAHSVIFSPVPDVSILKAVSWVVAMVTLLSAWRGLADAERLRMESQIFGELIGLMLLSLPLLAMSVGYLRNGAGFQGILNHPQAFGMTMALLAAWLASRILADRQPSWHIIGLFAVAFVLIIMSKARTAGLALLLGLFISASIGRRLARRSWRDFLPGLRSRRVAVTLALTLIGSLAVGPWLIQEIGAYLNKGTDSSSLINAYEASRGSVIEKMVENIEEHPWRGIGFGIASDLSRMEIVRDSLLGLPIGAAAEKGVAFLAIWEELGLMGLVAVLVWVWMLMRRAARGGAFVALSVCLTALFLNFGEAVLFSPGGMGMLLLILIAWAGSGLRTTTMGEAHA